jgi:hypothetical protein
VPVQTNIDMCYYQPSGCCIVRTLIYRPLICQYPVDLFAYDHNWNLIGWASQVNGNNRFNFDSASLRDGFQRYLLGLAWICTLGVPTPNLLPRSGLHPYANFKFSQDSAVTHYGVFKCFDNNLTNGIDGYYCQKTLDCRPSFGLNGYRQREVLGV